MIRATIIMLKLLAFYCNSAEFDYTFTWSAFWRRRHLMHDDVSKLPWASTNFCEETPATKNSTGNK